MARHYRFRPWMLNGHPGNVTRAVKRVIVRVVNHGLIVTSTTDGRHATTSWHFTTPGKAVDAGQDWAKDDAEQGRARKVRLQTTLLARGRGKWHELFGPDNHANVKNGVQITLIEGSGLEELHDTHVHAAPRALIRLPKPTQPERDRRLARRLKRRHGVQFAFWIIREARRAEIPVALAVALIEKETGFRNVWGGDPAPNGGTTGWNWRRVTRRDYRAYKQRRGPRGTGGMQGVGPAQLTWWEFQDDADRAGGCWKPQVNIRVAFARLAILMRVHGERQGIARYNGTGPAAQAYAEKVLERKRHWHEVIT